LISGGHWARQTARCGRPGRGPPGAKLPAMASDGAGCSWNGPPPNPSAISAIAAIRRAICAGHAIGAGEQAPRNAPLVGFRPAVALRCGHVLARRDLAIRRWVMSHTTPVSAVSGCLKSPRWPRQTGGMKSFPALRTSVVPRCLAASGLIESAWETDREQSRHRAPGRLNHGLQIDLQNRFSTFAFLFSNRRERASRERCCCTSSALQDNDDVWDRCVSAEPYEGSSKEHGLVAACAGCLPPRQPVCLSAASFSEVNVTSWCSRSETLGRRPQKCPIRTLLTT
jgi:hypothetical protein